MSLKLMLHTEPVVPLTEDVQLFRFLPCFTQKRLQMFAKTSWLYFRL